MRVELTRVLFFSLPLSTPFLSFLPLFSPPSSSSSTSSSTHHMVLFSLLLLCAPVVAAVTIYTQLPMFGPSAATSTAPQAMVTYAAHFDPLELTAPPAPTQAQAPSTPSIVPVRLAAGGMPGLSMPASGNFMGFSIELSVADQISACLSVHCHFFLHCSYIHILFLPVGRSGYVVLSPSETLRLAHLFQKIHRSRLSQSPRKHQIAWRKCLNTRRWQFSRESCIPSGGSTQRCHNPKEQG